MGKSIPYSSVLGILLRMTLYGTSSVAFLTFDIWVHRSILCRGERGHVRDGGLFLRKKVFYIEAEHEQNCHDCRINPSIT